MDRSLLTIQLHSGHTQINCQKSNTNSLFLCEVSKRKRRVHTYIHTYHREIFKNVKNQIPKNAEISQKIRF